MDLLLLLSYLEHLEGNRRAVWQASKINSVLAMDDKRLKIKLEKSIIIFDVLLGFILLNSEFLLVYLQCLGGSA